MLLSDASLDRFGRKTRKTSRHNVVQHQFLRMYVIFIFFSGEGVQVSYNPLKEVGPDTQPIQTYTSGTRLRKQFIRQPRHCFMK